MKNFENGQLAGQLFQRLRASKLSSHLPCTPGMHSWYYCVAQLAYSTCLLALPRPCLFSICGNWQNYAGRMQAFCKSAVIQLATIIRDIAVLEQSSNMTFCHEFTHVQFLKKTCSYWGSLLATISYDYVHLLTIKKAVYYYRSPKLICEYSASYNTRLPLIEIPFDCVQLFTWLNYKNKPFVTLMDLWRMYVTVRCVKLQLMQYPQ